MATIAWDCDDVLNDLMRCWLEQWWKPAHPECTVVYGELKRNPPHEILGVELKVYLHSLDAFRHSALAQKMKPLPEVLAWFRTYGIQHRHIVVTAVPLHAAPFCAQWVFRHFGNWVRCFHVVPSRLDLGIRRYHQSKGSFLRWFGSVDLFIDDSPAHIESLTDGRTRGLLFPRPWNNESLSTCDFLGELNRMIGQKAFRL